MIEQAKALAARPEVAAAKSPDEKVEALYRRVFARRPDEAERQAATRFLAGASTPGATPAKSRLEPVEQLAQVLLMTNELFFVD